MTFRLRAGVAQGAEQDRPFLEQIEALPPEQAERRPPTRTRARTAPPAPDAERDHGISL